jgi:hypothetical protein
MQKVGAKSGNQFVYFPTAIKMLRIDAGPEQINVIGQTVSVNFHGHFQVRCQRTLTTSGQKTAFNNVAKFQGRKKHGDPLLCENAKQLSALTHVHSRPT